MERIFEGLAEAMIACWYTWAVFQLRISSESTALEAH